MIDMLKRQLYLMRLALAFLTRIPVSPDAPSSVELQHSRRYYSLVGAVIGSVAALFYTVISVWFPALIAAPLTVTLIVVITGGLHEDGLADTVDAVAGGHAPEQRLAIMKDSRIGSFGTLALIAALMIKTAAIMALDQHSGALVGALIAGASISRAAAVIMMALLPYARLHNSKVVTLSDSPPSMELWLNVVIAIVISVVALGGGVTLVSAMAVAIVMWLLREWFWRRLGGFTGDCLGTLQVIIELMVYLIVIANAG